MGQNPLEAGSGYVEFHAKIVELSIPPGADFRSLLVLAGQESQLLLLGPGNSVHPPESVYYDPSAPVLAQAEQVALDIEKQIKERIHRAEGCSGCQFHNIEKIEAPNELTEFKVWENSGPHNPIEIPPDSPMH